MNHDLLNKIKIDCSKNLLMYKCKNYYFGLENGEKLIRVYS